MTGAAWFRGASRLATPAGRLRVACAAVTLVSALVPFLLAGAEPARAQAVSPASPSAPAPAPAPAMPAPAGSGERFFIALPENWVEVLREHQQGAEVLAYVPRGQTLQQWTDMLTIQVFRGMSALPLNSYYDRTLASYKAVCEGMKAGKMQNGVADGYDSAFWIMGCGRNVRSNAGETSFFRLVQGEKALYMAQRSWHSAPYSSGDGPSLTAEASQEAIGLLKSFGVCDPTRASHPCPQAR